MADISWLQYTIGGRLDRETLDRLLTWPDYECLLHYPDGRLAEHRVFNEQPTPPVLLTLRDELCKCSVDDELEQFLCAKRLHWRKKHGAFSQLDGAGVTRYDPDTQTCKTAPYDEARALAFADLEMLIVYELEGWSLPAIIQELRWIAEDPLPALTLREEADHAHAHHAP